MLRELQVGHLARSNGFVLVRNHRGYDLWSAKHGRFALRSCTLLDVKTYLGPNPAPAQPAKKKIKRVPMISSVAQVGKD